MLTFRAISPHSIEALLAMLWGEMDIRDGIARRNSGARTVVSKL